MSFLQDFGVRGDGKTDDTEAIRHAVSQGDGLLVLPRGEFLVTETIEIPLDRHGRTGIDGSGGTAQIIMQGKGPAFRFVGGHRGTAAPSSFVAGMLDRERMPTVQNLEIIGRHEEADGIELAGTMQAVINGVALRSLRHGIHLVNRNRNVIITNCQIYHNRGAGVFLDGVNLHQINIHGNHISYGRLGGIRIERSEIRNLQIVGNDIEYNNDKTHELDKGSEPIPTAEIYVDVTAEGASVNEVTVSGNTIQATASPNGANIRIIDDGKSERAPGLWAITGNVIGSQTNNVHLTGCRGVTITGNSIYSCVERNLLLENCRQIVFCGNQSRRHTAQFACGWRLVDSANCTISSSLIIDDTDEGQATGASLLEIDRCKRINVSSCQLLGGTPHGIDVKDASYVNINSCQIIDAREVPQSRHPIRFRGQGTGNSVTGCTFSEVGNEIDHQPESGVMIGENVF